MVSPPTSIVGVNRVLKMSILGVKLHGDFGFTDHISEVLTSCARSLYLAICHTDYGSLRPMVLLLNPSTLLLILPPYHDRFMLPPPAL